MSFQSYFCTTLFFVLVSASWRVTSTREYQLGILLPYTFDGGVEYPLADRYASAVTLAVENVNSDPALLPGARLSFVWNNTACNQTKMVAQQHWQIKQGVVGFVGPSCHARKAAKIAQKHELALISFDSHDSHVSNKNLYPNFARTNPQDTKAVLKLLDLVKSRGWKRVNVVYQTDRKWISLKRFLTRQLGRHGIAFSKPVSVDLFDIDSAMPDIESLVDQKSQATILLTSLDVTREVMFNLETFFEKSDSSASYLKHTFVNVPLNRLGTNLNTKFPFKWFFSAFRRHTPEDEKKTQKAFKKLLIVTNVPIQETEQFKLFEKNLKKKASQAPWFSEAFKGCLVLNGECIFNKSDAKIPLKAVYLHDAVMQFARGLHEVLNAGEKPTGKNIIDKLKKTHFIGADGFRHTFDENADVLYDYTILGLRKDKKKRLNMLPIESENRVFFN